VPDGQQSGSYPANPSKARLYEGFPPSAPRELFACGHFPSQLVEEVHKKDHMILRLL
jgi:hypothetical protein